MSSQPQVFAVGVPQQQEMRIPLAARSLPDEPDVPMWAPGPPLAQAAFACCFWNPGAWAGCCVLLPQNEQKAVLYCGRYVGTLREPGIHCLNPCGRELRSASARLNTLELKDIKVLDARGSPIMISGVVTYALVSAKKACVDVDDTTNYIRLQSTTVLKQVASRYPYSAGTGQPSLQTEGPAIARELVQVLQEKVAVAGAHISNFEIVDLSYAPEIAQVMLVRQQAEALVDARRLIVSAAVDMTQQATAQLESKGVALSDGARETLTSNLMTVICSHSPATPTVALK